MKRSDLHREWARVLDMCESSGVDPKHCWKYDSVRPLGGTPLLDSNPAGYEFAVAILEGKPVFVGNKLYGKLSKKYHAVEQKEIDSGDWNVSDPRRWSWTPLNKFFMLNGQESPCPDDSNIHELRVIGFDDCVYCFRHKNDLVKVENALNKLLNP